jgi:3',5'-cyclic-AMP phosphodiesterase
MIIAQISDTHIARDTPDADRRLRDLASAIADINALDPAPDAIVHTGDIVDGGRQDEYALAASALAAARAPLYIVAGNKDNRTNLRAAFATGGYLRPGSHFIDYAVDDFPLRLIALDTLNPAGNKGDFCAERARRLIDLIDAETTKPIVVFTHHPPFEVMVGPDRLHFETPGKMALLRCALQHSGRVVAVCSGHVHRAAAGHVGGIPATVAPWPRDDAALWRLSAAHADPPGLSGPPVRSGAGLRERNPDCRSRQRGVSGRPAAAAFRQAREKALTLPGDRPISRLPAATRRFC